MPELPEVESIVLALQNSPIFGTPIERVEIFWNKIALSHVSKDFAICLIGLSIVKIQRRAKYLIFYLSNGFLAVLHLRMTGKILLKSANSPHYFTPIIDYKKNLNIDGNLLPLGKVAMCYSNLQRIVGTLAKAVMSDTSIRFLKTGICPFHLSFSYGVN